MTNHQQYKKSQNIHFVAKYFKNALEKKILSCTEELLRYKKNVSTRGAHTMRRRPISISKWSILDCSLEEIWWFDITSGTNQRPRGVNTPCKLKYRASKRCEEVENKT